MQKSAARNDGKRRYEIMDGLSDEPENMTDHTIRIRRKWINDVSDGQKEKPCSVFFISVPQECAASAVRCCSSRGLGMCPNKRFVCDVARRHCLRKVSGIPDNESYTEFGITEIIP